MSDIVERLRTTQLTAGLRLEAADEIERLEAEYEERHAENNELFKRAVEAETEIGRLRAELEKANAAFGAVRYATRSTTQGTP